MFSRVRRAGLGGVLNRRLFHGTSSLLDRIVPFKLADIGEGIAEVEVLQWFVKPGDTVRQFDKICEVQSDKATVDISSRYDGVIKSVEWQVGDMAQVGSTLVEISVEGDEPVAEKPQQPKQEEKQEEQEEQLVEIVRPSKILEGEGSFTIDPVIRPPSEEYGQTDIRASFETERVLATPAVRRLASDHSLDLSLVPASGKGGRVLKGDVLQYIATVPIEERRRQAQAAQEVVAETEKVEEEKEQGEKSTTGQEKLQADVVLPVKGIQRIMVKAMEASLEIPHFNFMEEYEMTKLAEFRSQLKPVAQERGIKLSYMPILIKAASLSLIQFPQLNSHFNAKESTVIQKASHNIGVAMDTPRGLLVPVIKDCQEKSIFDIANDLVTYQRLGADNKLGEKELGGLTFTLSNIGAIGGTYASPIIPSPTVAIGAMGKIQSLPRFIDESDLEKGFYNAKVINISWAADHRILDGATVARFSNQLKEYIENPLSLVTDMK